MKLIFGLIGGLLMVLFLGAVFVKLKIVALGIVMAVGVAMMGYDTWLSLGE